MIKKSLIILSMLLFSSNAFALTIELDKPVIAYDEPNKDSNQIHLLIAEPIELIQEVDDYYKASSKFQNTSTFYIPKSAIGSNLLSPLFQTLTATGMDIVTTSLNYLSTPYVYGGNSLETGVDCSSFVQLIYGMHNISLSRTSREQFLNNGFFVEETELRPGDLVFFGTTSHTGQIPTYGIEHLGLYVGDGMMIHASTSVRGVVIDGIHDRGFPDLVGFKRIIP